MATARRCLQLGAARRTKESAAHNLASLMQPLEGQKEIFDTTLDETETQKVGLSANLARDFTRLRSVGAQGDFTPAPPGGCTPTEADAARRESCCAEDPCRTSVQSRSSVLHRHAGGYVLIPIGRSSGLSWSDRGHHVPALTVTSGGRGVGFDVACSGTPARHRLVIA